MKTALLQIQPREDGKLVSWLRFKRGRLVDPTPREKRTGFTVALTDPISSLWDIARAIDPGLEAEIACQRGLLFPSFALRLIGRDFEIEAQKQFAGGSNRSSCFNYRVNVIIYSELRERIEQILATYRSIGSPPLYCFVKTVEEVEQGRREGCFETTGKSVEGF